MLRVLAYHRIAEYRTNAAVDDRTISATPSVFREQMRHIARCYRCVPMPEVVDAIERNRPLPRRSVLITFDDAYSDFVEVAWPILKDFRLTATMFVPTAFPGDPGQVFWWDKLYRAFCGTARMRLEHTPIGPLSLVTWDDRERSLRALQDYVKTVVSDQAMQLVDWVCAELLETPLKGGSVLSWDQLRQFARDGLTLGSHTQTHPIITQLSPKRIREEIRGSQQDLKREIGVALPIFCYPNGNYNDQVIKTLKEEQIRIAFTTIPGGNVLNAENLLRVGRTCITPRTSRAVFRARLLPLGVQLDAWRHRKERSVLTRMYSQNRLTKSMTAFRATRPPGDTGQFGRVAYIVSAFPVLPETFVLYDMIEMEKLGVRVELYPLRRLHRRLNHPEANAWIKRAHYRPFLSWGVLRSQWRFLRRDPIGYVKLWSDVLHGTWGSADFFLGAIAIFPKAVLFAEEMMKQEVTHVHAHFANHPATAAFIIHRLTGIPFSFIARGTDVQVDRHMLKEKIEAAEFAIAVSADNKKIMVEECGPHVAQKIVVMHGGVDVDRLTPCPRRTAGPFQIVCVARFEEVKGHTFLVEACRILRERKIAFECRLIGGGSLAAKIRKQVRRTNLRDQIVFLGERPYPQVIEELRQADALVLPTAPTANGKREGSPTALKEAMACGVPVVGSLIGGIPELVDDGRTGLLVPPRDAVALADALERLARDRSLGQRLGSAGREKVVRDFNLKIITARCAKVFLDKAAIEELECNSGVGKKVEIPVPAELHAQRNSGVGVGNQRPQTLGNFV